MNGFTPYTADESLEPHTARCNHCQKIIPTGILNISRHWSECSGKEVYEIIKGIDESDKTIQQKMAAVKKLLSLD